MEFIISSENKQATDLIRIYLNKYDLADMVADKTGLFWHIDSIKIKDAKSNGDYEGNDTVLIDFGRGIWALSGIVHELVHLILKQNNWSNNDVIKDFINVHQELSVGDRGAGYLLEQIIAYIIQSEAEFYIGTREDNKLMQGAWSNDRFNKIIETEYKSEFLRDLAYKFMENWSSKKGDNLIKWINSVIG